jgi:hypothetical protein
MSGVRSLVRNSTIKGYATANSAPIYVDSDDNRVKLIPAGTGTTEVVLQEASGAGFAEVVTATNVLTAAESGKVFFLSAAGGFATTLPAPALGLNFTFIVKTAPTSVGYTIVSESAAEIIVGGVHDAGGAAGDVESTVGATTITFVANQSVLGDKAILHSDGTNWYARVFVNVAAGATFTG